ncbi:hypothetical protein GCM10009765_18800 [Fodinicola feengrottensis]|uniref:Peptidase S53 domain-containing protein n=1 Tax=Fodinicola feengrottensis TaxID=435914 RepID=A0ABN2GDU2_9ACTN
MALVLGVVQPAGAAPTGPSAAKPGTAKPAVTAQCGTSSKTVFRCFALKRTDTASGTGIRPLADPPAGYGPGDLQAAYGLPANGGAGQTVAIVDAYDNPNAEADLTVYRAQYGLPACTTANGCFKKVNQRGVQGSYPAPNTGWAGEIALDVDMVSASAPQAHIILVEADSANFDDLGSSVNTAVSLGAKFVSNSYGTNYTSTPGSGEDPAELTWDDQYYKHPGVAVTVSSGDGDYGVAYPAASQYVTSVGGTALTKDSSARGWSESVWHNQYGGPGSGCSTIEPKPAFQHDTGCANRAVADVSAVADPATGVSVYNTYGDSGWRQYGGTSASSPIIAGVYASAGTPAAGSFPNSLPYDHTSALNDVTTGLNGTCNPAYLCTAGPGYDGPTGLGTPKGVAAFSSGPHGELLGTVTDSGSGAPVAGAKVAAGDLSATTDATGKYDLSIGAGTYDLTTSAYGYTSQTVSGVVVGDGAKITTNFALASVPKVSLSGTIIDGSGHGWPLYASVGVNGTTTKVSTDPATGRYSIDLPASNTYTLHVASNVPGYDAADVPVTLGSSDLHKDLTLKVSSACTAPGYTYTLNGTSQSFDTTSTPAGWTVANATADGGWEFDDPGKRGNKTGGAGGFAIVDSDKLGVGKTQNTTLTSPVYDLSGSTNPVLTADTHYQPFGNSTAAVDVTTDGGTTWTNLWQRSTVGVPGPAKIDLPVTGAAGKNAVQLRFHYTGSFAYYWELDNVFVGDRSCVPVHGGLVVGHVTDGNTHAGVTGAVVTDTDKPAENATTATDAGQGDGYYWFFSSATGAHNFTAAKGGYTTATASVNVGTDGVTKADFTLAAGQLKVTPATISKTVPWGGQATANVKITNSGSAPATYKIGEAPGGFTQQTPGGKGAAVHNVPVKPVTGSMKIAAQAAKKTAAPKDANPSDAPWAALANFPTIIQDNLAIAGDGKVFSEFGYAGSDDTADLYSYDSASGAWTKLGTSPAGTREAPAGGYVNGKIYASGGWGASGAPLAATSIYDVASNSWSTGAAMPTPYAGSGHAVLDGKIYAVGGCTADACGVKDVQVYDTAANTWSKVADYPEAISWVSCGGINGVLYCAGGNTGAATTKHSYAYSPSSNSWSPVADLPSDAWGAGYAAANGKLLVSGGVINSSAAITNTGFAYDPAGNAWTALPNSNNSLYRAGSALGFYKVGGNPGGFGVPPQANAEVLPGYDQGGSSDVTWLSESATTGTLAPGKSATVTVTLDASVPEITQPGVLTANLSISGNTPYGSTAIPVSFTVKPPTTWGKITGTVTTKDASGALVPLAGATVEIDSWATSYTLKTDANGNYGLWLDYRNNPLTLIVAKDGFRPQTTTVSIKQGAVTTKNFTLVKP